MFRCMGTIAKGLLLRDNFCYFLVSVFLILMSLAEVFVSSVVFIFALCFFSVKLSWLQEKKIVSEFSKEMQFLFVSPGSS